MALARFQMTVNTKDLYWQMQKDYIFPNFHIYNTMVNTHCKEGKVIEAVIYLNYLLQEELDPDTHTYTSFILGYRADDDLVRAC